MHQTKKGNTWHFGLKAHIGVDAESGLVHTVIATAANRARRQITEMIRTKLGLAGKGREVEILARVDTTKAQRRFAPSYSRGMVIQCDCAQFAGTDQRRSADVHRHEEPHDVEEPLLRRHQPRRPRGADLHELDKGTAASRIKALRQDDGTRRPARARCQADQRALQALARRRATNTSATMQGRWRRHPARPLVIGFWRSKTPGRACADRRMAGNSFLKAAVCAFERLMRRIRPPIAPLRADGALIELSYIQAPCCSEIGDGSSLS